MKTVFITENKKFVEKCGVCGRTLSTHKSVKMGFGPKCLENKLFLKLKDKLEEMDNAALEFQKSFDKMGDEEIDKIDNFVDNVFNKKMKFLNDLIVSSNVKIAKGNKEYKKLKKLVLSYSSYLLNNLYKNEEDSFFSKKSVIVLANSIETADKEILLFIPPNQKFFE